jgi:hypothetical protein
LRTNTIKCFAQVLIKIENKQEVIKFVKTFFNIYFIFIYIFNNKIDEIAIKQTESSTNISIEFISSFSFSKSFMSTAKIICRKIVIFDKNSKKSCDIKKTQFHVEFSKVNGLVNFLTISLKTTIANKLIHYLFLFFEFVVQK